MAEEKELKIEIPSASFEMVLGYLKSKFSICTRKCFVDEYYDFPKGILHNVEHVLRFRYIDNDPQFSFKTIFYLPKRAGEEWFVDEESCSFPSPVSFFNNLFLRLGCISTLTKKSPVTANDVVTHLLNNGLILYIVIKKQRYIFEEIDTKYMLDIIENLGLFLEIEANVEPNRKLIELNLPVEYHSIRSGFTNLYLQRVKGVKTPSNDMYFKNPMWNVLPNEYKLYISLNQLPENR